MKYAKRERAKLLITKALHKIRALAREKIKIKIIHLLVFLLLIPIVNAIYQDNLTYDANWHTHIVKSYPGYEEAIVWNEPSLYVNYTKPQKELNLSVNWLILKVKSNERKICYEVTIGSWMFDVQSLVSEMPLNKLVVWKNISIDSFDKIQIKYKLCTKARTIV